MGMLSADTEIMMTVRLMQNTRDHMLFLATLTWLL